MIGPIALKINQRQFLINTFKNIKQDLKTINFNLRIPILTFLNPMKKITLLLILLAGHFSYAQVGIGTATPNLSSQLDVYSTNKGLMIPQVALASLTDATTITSGNVNSLLVYNTSTVATLTPGYYYWSVNTWNRLMTESSMINQVTMPKFFYMPSIAMPTSRAHIVTGDGFSVTAEGVFSVSLYARYNSQFKTQEVKNPDRTTTLPVIAADKLDYYITSYDMAVFETVILTNTGVLTYKIKTGAQVTAATFMNIVFAVRL